jgi:hypothetical protein
MKLHIFAFVACLLTLSCLGQEFKFYLNGSNIKDSAFESFKQGDVLRVIFSNKTSPYNFRIASLLVTLTPVKNIEGSFAGTANSFLIDNSSKSYSASPSFTIDLYERIAMLKHNEFDISVKVQQLFADTPEGNNWIHNTIQFKEVYIQKRMP